MEHKQTENPIDSKYGIYDKAVRIVMMLDRKIYETEKNTKQKKIRNRRIYETEKYTKQKNIRNRKVS